MQLIIIIHSQNTEIPIMAQHMSEFVYLLHLLHTYSYL